MKNKHGSNSLSQHMNYDGKNYEVILLFDFYKLSINCANLLDR